MLTIIFRYTFPITVVLFAYRDKILLNWSWIAFFIEISSSIYIVRF